MHVRGFTRHESSRADFPGTYRGVVEKLDHLKVICWLTSPILRWSHLFFSKSQRPLHLIDPYTNIDMSLKV